MPDWLSNINDWLSLVGFFVTAYTLYEVYKIKSSFLARARLPDVIKELAKSGSNLSSSLGGWPAQRNDARTAIKIAGSLLRSAEPMLAQGERAEIKKVRIKLEEAVKKIAEPTFTSDFAWDLYSDVQSSLVTLSQVSKNMKWE